MRRCQKRMTRRRVEACCGISYVVTSFGSYTKNSGGGQERAGPFEAKIDGNPRNFNVGTRPIDSLFQLSENADLAFGQIMICISRRCNQWPLTCGRSQDVSITWQTEG